MGYLISAMILLALFIPGPALAQTFQSPTISNKGALSRIISTVFDKNKTSVTSTPQTSFLTQPTPTPRKTPKNLYKIAVIGDSMVDTMGERLEYLEGALKKKYPNTKFDLYNYGKGAENVEDAFLRLKEEFDYSDRLYPSIYQVNPDIIVVGSFGYNPFAPHNKRKYLEKYTQFVIEMQKIADEIYILAEITPLRAGFGRGPNGVNWDTNGAYEQSAKIIEQLETAIEVGEILKLPVINAFKTSQISASKEVDKKLVNTSDGIHPSVEGHKFMADQIVSIIKLK